MESMNSSSGGTESKVQETTDHLQNFSDQWFNERFESLLPQIQEKWPDMARQTLEATRGSLDELIRVISNHSGKTKYGVKEQLEELFDSAGIRTKDLADSLEPLEKQLEDLLDDLNESLRPRIEKPIKKRPLLSIGIAAGLGLILGMIVSGGRK